MNQILHEQFLINIFDELGSTNTQLAKDALSKNLDEFNVYLAHKQTKGKGRINRKWQSYKENLQFSILLKPNISISKIHHINFISVIALGNIIKNLNYSNLNISYKWPNDLIINDRKIAGILLESLQGTNNEQLAILGIGVNIGNSPKNTTFPSQNLKDLGIIIDKITFLKDFLTEFKKLYNGWIDFGFRQYRKIWLENAYNLNKIISISNGKKEISAIFKGITEDGELEIIENNRIITIRSADISPNN
ncbi:MAG: biotin--[acetyl-CoA-carboxylase] ligase [Rickettsiales bacterium]|jgi:BirA family transcriptional regulator, biotin operon repressor / biotin---[acetyl-CoA-carboxylase] ligase|nr:biotin--[acetyl-CoA-carboxylase] ligase [Rickettsiales bacterium]|tara:strand:- start:25778 stop:26524 length:747 start_codon:yes stop_codon:yes gene_type:complete